MLVSKTLAEIAAYIRPGLTTLELDIKAEDFIRSHDAVPSFKGYRNFPASLCISVNDEVVHGIPSSSKIIKEGDVLSVDCGVFKNGYHGDSAYTFMVGNVPEEYFNLAEVTKEALKKGIAEARSGNKVGDISFAIQQYAEKKYGFGVVRELVGHGVGHSLHEEPEVPNFGKRGNGPKLLPGLVIAVEPMVNLRTKHVTQDADGWTIRTKDRKVSVHFEHTIAIRKGPADVLSSFGPIEEAEQKNEYLYKAKAETV